MGPFTQFYITHGYCERHENVWRKKKPEPFMNCVLETREMFALNLAMIHGGDLGENFGSYL